MEIGTLLVLLMIIACPIMMGGMMWWMMRNNQSGQINQPSKHWGNANQQDQLVEAEVNPVENEIAT